MASHRPPVGVRKSVLRVRWDEDDIAGMQQHRADRAVQLELALQDHQGLGLAGVTVRGDRLIRLGRHLAKSPAAARLLGVMTSRDLDVALSMNAPS